MKSYLEVLKNWTIPEVLEIKEIQDEVFEVICINIKYILKVRDNFEKIETEYALLNHLMNEGIPVPMLIKTISGDFYGDIECKKYCLYNFIEGSHLRYDYEADNKNVLYLHGKALGELHRAMNSYRGSTDNIKDMNLESTIFDWTIPVINKFRENNRIGEIIDDLSYELKGLYNTLPKQFIHRDPHSQNLLFKNETLSGIIDFDICMIGYKPFDLCYLMLESLVNVIGNEEKRNQWITLIPVMISGYESEYPLSNLEREAFWHMFLSIEMIFIAYFYDINNPKEAETALACLYWLYDNKLTITKA